MLCFSEPGAGQRVVGDSRTLYAALMLKFAVKSLYFPQLFPGDFNQSESISSSSKDGGRWAINGSRNSISIIFGLFLVKLLKVTETTKKLKQSRGI